MSNANSPQRCIIAVGNTGNGKSFTATIFGAKNVKIGHSTQSETKTITVYNIDDGGFYIDTPGFDDSDEDKTDDDNVRSIFRKVVEKRIRDITTILWFVTPDDRAQASYKRQAKFIESLAKYFNGNVWDNTIIVTKGDKIKDGPRDAAKEVAKVEHNTNVDLLSNTSDFKILLFESLPAEHVYVEENFTSDKLNRYGVFKGSEPERILAKYESLMKRHLDHPIRFNLKIFKCSKCPEKTDPRLASPECHLKTELFHPSMKHIHPGNVVDIHTGSDFYEHPDYYVQVTTKKVFDERLEAWVVRVVTVGIVNPERDEFVPGYYKCCNNSDVNSTGCKRIYNCCRKDYNSPGCKKIYDGCKHECNTPTCRTICGNCNKELNTNGCQNRCKECKNVNFHNEKGCIKTDHDFQ